MLNKLLQRRYEIKQRLGGGSSGETFLATDGDFPGNPVCVVKQLKPQQTDSFTLQTARRLFESEAIVLSRLGEHDQIPRLLAHFEDQMEFYLVQQFIPGHSLDQELHAGQCWEQAQVIAFLQDLLQTLSYIHQQGVVHRDLKPTNLIRRQSDQKIVVTDFGAVKAITTPVVIVQEQPVFSFGGGTADYMPAEQLNGTPNFSSDVYAVGIMALQALTGRTPQQMPHDSTTGEILWLSAKVSPALADILDKMVRYDHQQRYSSATEALAALNQLPRSVTPVNGTRRRMVQLVTVIGMGVGIASLLYGLQQQTLTEQAAVPRPIGTPSKKTSVVKKDFKIERVEAQLKEKLTAGIGLDTTVNCPVAAKLGTDFDCDATAEGKTFQVAITKSNESGAFQFQSKGLLRLVPLEEQIQSTIKAKKNVDVTADCSEGAGAKVKIVKAGDTFTCKVKTPSGETKDATVYIEDEKGNVKWHV